MEEPTRGGSKKPACDNCKARKTKCDRGSPCSACVTAELDCRVTSQALGKRQRVLISDRYDEAMENVDRSLQDISHALQKLLQISENPQPSLDHPPVTFFGNHFSDMSKSSEGYRGDSSFMAHVQRVTDALRHAASNLEFSMIDPASSATMSATQMIQEAANSEESSAGLGGTPSPPAHVQYPELVGRPLPPLEHVLKLLRLAQSEKQRLFIDVPVVDEHEFGEVCQKIYFAINGYSIFAWIMVNTGLFYLFLDLEEHNYSRVGATLSSIQSHLRVLTGNVEAAIQSLRLCQDSSIEACQALALLATFCIKSGRGPAAWSLIAAASRMCIDLGLHRLAKDTEGSAISTERKVFWHVYIMDKGMAFTLGRTPSIHQYDVATERPTFPKDLPGVPGYLYAGFIEYAVIVGEMHVQLFSAAAQRRSQQTRTEIAKSFASRLIQFNRDFKQSRRDDPPTDAFQPASILLDIIMHSLVTIVYRIVPCDEADSNVLRCSPDCIEAARQALSMIVRAGEAFGQHHPVGWTMFLNMLFSLVPFACFIVLAGNTMASLSTKDLALLSATVSAIKPISTSSVSGRRLFRVCKTFYELTNYSVARQTALPRGAPRFSASATSAVYPPTEWGLAMQLGNPEAFSFEHIIAAQDWDAVMNEFEGESGAGGI